MENSENHDPRDRNNEMVKAMQHWKMTAALRENEKLELMKEVNELRLKLSRLRNAESTHTRKLNAELQSASEEALSHLVNASSAVARMLELVKSYIQGKRELESALPRWSSLSNTPTKEKVNRVPPLLIGGRHIQPVVSLSRTLQPTNSRIMSNRSPNQINRSVSARAVPMHMLQDVFIPLTRIDAEIPISNGDVNPEEANDSTNDLASDDSSERMDEPVSGRDDFEESQRLETVVEEMEFEDETAQRPIDPLEGPSWLLDVPAHNNKRKSKNQTTSEPDSTTQLHANASPGPSRNHLEVEGPVSVTVACEFTPTVRRRRRASPRRAAGPRVITPLVASPRVSLSPHFSPRPARRNSTNAPILKVMVAKMRLSDDEDSDSSPPKSPNLDQITTKRPNRNEQKPNKTEIPPKRPKFGEMQPKPQKILQRRSPESPIRRESSTKRHSSDGSPICQVHLRDLTPSQRLMRFDAPSPNGSTDACVIVLETSNDQLEPCCSGVSRERTLSRTNSRENQQNHSNHGNHSNSSHDNHPTNSNHNPTSHDNRLAKTRNNQPNHTGDHSKNNHENHPASTRDNHSNHNRANNHDNHTSQNNHSNGIHSSYDHNNRTANMTSTNHDTCSYVSDNRNSSSLRSRLNSHNGNGSDSSNSDAVSEGRTRRPRKAVVYKEKPLNRKLRR
ncbi:homeobox protein 2-like isoform X1 [Maniola jurtina]|uniref:homeobox protein 2-like isoform X1 n=1 Tax=Maniola jurtina TaxID=191418 RepID=UPI001E68CC09|nr:homeobox protein 2-like isoform X1 [Maniola jurtina]